MNAAPRQLDLTAPPIVKTIGQRSLIVAAVFGIAALALAFLRTDEFFRAYLLGYMCWLGVALGSMAIIMIRHLTGGGWGVVIRRIQGAAMRTLPILAMLFIPIAVAVLQGRLFPWAMASDAISDPHIREHLEKHSFIKSAYLNPRGFIIRAIIYFAIWNLLSYLLSLWSKQGDHPNAPDNTPKFKAVAGPGLILYGFTITFAVIDWIMSLDPSWISTIFGLAILIGEVLSAMCFAVVIERILFNYKPMSDMLKPDYVHDHGKWILAFTMAHHLGGKLAQRDHVLPDAAEWRMGQDRPHHRTVPLRGSFRNSAVASLQTRYSQAGVAGGRASRDALCRSVLDHRAQFFEDVQCHHRRHRRSRRHRRGVADVLFP
jgi:hypothetical protein